MQPAQDAFAAARMVILGKVGWQPSFSEDALLVGFHEKTAVVTEDLGFNDEQAGDIGRGDVHKRD